MSQYSFIRMIVLLVPFLIQYTHAQQPQALAPVLIGPYDGSDVSENHIVWTWFMQPQASNSEEIICDLKVVEVLDGQTPEEALRLNPLVILKEDLTTSAWQTNFAARNFLPGHRYAWRVIAKVRDKLTQKESIVSESEIWTYTYNTVQPDVVPPTDTTAPAGSAPQADADALQNNSIKALEFTGRTRLTMEHNDAIGLLTQSPKNVARWQVEPTVKIFGVPFGLNLLVTSEENTRQSDVTRGAFGSQNTKRGLNVVLEQQVEEKIAELEQARDSASADSLRVFAGMDSVAIASRISALYELENKDLTENMELLKDLGLATPEQEVIAQFPALGFGKVAPSFSRFMFNGVTMNGGMAEYNPGMFYAAGALGKVQREFDVSIISNDALQRDSALLTNVQLFKNLYSARIGYGRRNGNHITASVLYSDDDDQTVAIQNAVQRVVFDTTVTIVQVPVLTSGGDTLRDPDDSTRVITRDSSVLTTSSRQNLALARQQNTVVGLAAHYTFDSLNVTLDGEMNISYFKDEKNKLWSDSSARIGVRSARFFRENIRHSEFEQIDMMYSVRSVWNFLENAGKLSGGLRYIGGGYVTAGVAALRKDIFRADAAYSQAFYQRQIRLHAAYSFEEFGYKRSSVSDSLLSTITSISGGTDVRLRGLPVLSFNYTRHGQSFIMERDTSVPDPTDSTLTVTKKVNDKSQNVIEQFVVSASHLYGESWLRMSSFASYMHQAGTVQRSIDGGRFEDQVTSPNSFTSTTVQVSQRFGFGSAVNAGASASYTSTASSSRDSTSVWSLDCSVIVLPVQWLPVTVGYVRTRDEHDGDATNALYVTLSATPSEDVNVTFRLDSRAFSKDNAPDIVPPGFTGTTARLITNYRW
ncbi:MAG: hypothetical protein JNL32_05225 [Candidatus Kapabacteria bacterium]|nr:hypothetical protein [Candidatus Kapabacteria bacterium]